MTPLACPLLIICLSLPPFPGQGARAEDAPAGAQEPKAAEAAETGETAASNFALSGAALLYDTESGTRSREIANRDVDELRRLLRENEGIATLRLNSGGGSVWAAKELARIVIDFGLDTEVDGECSSSCTRVFLAGEARRMLRGSKIGFHSRRWRPAPLEAYYKDWREDEGWDTPFDFASWVYDDTWAEAHEALTWIVGRGVDAEFAIEIFAPRDNMWYPDRAELQAAGILRD